MLSPFFMPVGALDVTSVEDPLAGEVEEKVSALKIEAEGGKLYCAEEEKPAALRWKGFPRKCA